MPTEFPKTPDQIDGPDGETRRRQRVALARQMAVDGVGMLRIARDCDMNPISMVRVLECTTFADGPFPEHMSKKDYVAAWEARKVRETARDRSGETTASGFRGAI